MKLQVRQVNENERSGRSKTEVLRINLSQVTYCGGYSGGVPPHPIPNREVKPAIADGTAPPGGRVGSCRSSKVRLDDSSRTFLFMDVRGQVGRLPIQPFPWEGSNRFAPAPMFLLLRAGFGRFSARTGRFCLIRASFGRFFARIERFRLSGASFKRFLAREGRNLQLASYLRNTAEHRMMQSAAYCRRLTIMC